jgi:hypothetical protein
MELERLLENVDLSTAWRLFPLELLLLDVGEVCRASWLELCAAFLEDFRLQTLNILRAENSILQNN